MKTIHPFLLHAFSLRVSSILLFCVVFLNTTYSQNYSVSESFYCNNASAGNPSFQANLSLDGLPDPCDGSATMYVNTGIYSINFNSAPFTTLLTGGSEENTMAADLIPVNDFLVANQFEEYTIDLSFFSAFPANELEVLWKRWDKDFEAKTDILYSDSDFSPGGGISGNISFDFKPDRGSTKGFIVVVLRDELYGANANGVTLALYLPIMVNGPVNLSDSGEVDTIGTSIYPAETYLILHDPPGDGSFSTWTSNKKFCRETSDTYTEAGGASTSLAASWGTKGSIGIGVTQEFEASVTVEAEVGLDISRTNTESLKTCFDLSSTTNTEASASGIGRDADLFIGYSRRTLTGIFDYFEVDCSTGDTSTVKRKVEAIDPDNNGLQTFIKSKASIESEMLTLQNEIPNLVGTEKTIKQNQLDAWISAINLYENSIAEAEALPVGESINVPDSGNTSSTWTTSVSTTTTQTRSVTLNTSASITAVVSVGANGVEGNFTATYESSQGNTFTSDDATEDQMTYFLQDDDGDLINLDILRNPWCGTPYFRVLQGARTSCPYEGGYAIDQPELILNGTCPNNNNVQIDIPEPEPSNVWSIQYQICNNSDQGRTYSLKLSNNTNNLLVNALGGNITSGWRNQFVDENSCVDANLDISRPQTTPPSPLQYEDLRLRLIPSCLIEFENDNVDLLNAEASEVIFDVNFDPNTTDSDCDGISNLNDNCPDVASINIGLDFNENNDYVEIPHDPVFNLADGDFSFEAWIYSEFNNAETILSKGPSTLSSNDLYLFQVNPLGEGKIALELGNTAGGGQWVYSNTGMAANQWNHVAVTLSKAGSDIIVSFYLNGLFDGSDSYSFMPNNSDSNPLFLARQGLTCTSNCGNNFDGALDELRIWDKELTEADIQTNMYNSLLGNESDLVAYYTFNEGEPGMNNTALSTLIDVSGNGHDGILRNMALSGGSSNWVNGAPVNFIDADGNGIGDFCEDACPPDYANGNSLTGSETGTISYTAGGLIQSTQTIASGADVEYNAGTDIELNESFEVQGGAIFHAYIEGCGS